MKTVCGREKRVGKSIRTVEPETMKEEKVPRFHIFAQVDYSGLFSGSAACLVVTV